MKLGEYVANYREAHGLSQREFARRCDLSNVVIGFLESGKRTNGDVYLPRIDTIRKLAHGMGMAPDALIAQCDDTFNLGLSVGPEETPLFEDIFHEKIQERSADENMLIQVYRMIPVEHRFEAMHALLNIKDKYANV